MIWYYKPSLKYEYKICLEGYIGIGEKYWRETSSKHVVTYYFYSSEQ